MDDTSMHEKVVYDEEITEKDVLDIEENSSSGNSNKNENDRMKTVAEGMMDITLLTANANQLRFVLTYDEHRTSLFYISFVLIVLSLILQICVGLAIILKRTNLKKSQRNRTHQYHVAGIFVITFINVLIAVITTCNVKTGEK